MTATATATAPGVTAAAPGATVIGAAAEFSARLEAERRAGRSVGVVLTMGALHEGHSALVTRAAHECDVVAVSIFVNPTQFGDQRDLRAYPRTLESDLEVAGRAGADVVFAPSVAEIYPDWPEPAATTVTVASLGDRWEGISRPGHFDAVATVVVKLLALAGRCRTYFGEKDFQQLAVVRRAVRDLSLPVEVVGCATVRQPDGLATSSRNALLDPAERAAATCLYRALVDGAATLAAGGDRAGVEAAMAAAVDAEPLAELDYAALVDARDLEPTEPGAGRTPGGPVGARPPLRLLVAARVGAVRLIDNLDPRSPRSPRSPR